MPGFFKRRINLRIEFVRRKPGMGGPGVMKNFSPQMARGTKRDAIFRDIAAMGHFVAIGNMMGVQVGQVDTGAVKRFMGVAALSILAGCTTYRAAVAIPVEHRGAKCQTNLSLCTHGLPLVCFKRMRTSKSCSRS